MIVMKVIHAQHVRGWPVEDLLVGPIISSIYSCDGIRMNLLASSELKADLARRC